MASKPPEISVVIPAYNEATYIDRLLEALAKQSFKDFEVIVSDAESNDGTDKVVKSFKDKLDIKFVESPPKGPGHGRNEGAKAAKGEWLLFLDADGDIDDPNFISILLDKTIEKGWKTSSAKMKAKAPFALSILYRYQKFLAHTKHPVAQGWCILTRRNIFEENNGFNEKILFGEDNDYVSRVGKYGFGFVDDTYYYVDLRRNKQEGIGLIVKGLKNEIYRHTRGYNLEKNPHKYEFGKHRKRQQ